jgi:hypothetical protein
LALVTDIDQLSQAISHATAPAFMLGAVAAFYRFSSGVLSASPTR